MICLRCKQEIPEFLFFETLNVLDHLVLTDHPPTLYRNDDFGNNEVKITMHVYAKKQLCSNTPVDDSQMLKRPLITNSPSNEGLWFRN